MDHVKTQSSENEPSTGDVFGTARMVYATKTAFLQVWVGDYRGVFRVRQWVQLYPSIFVVDMAETVNLHPSIEILLA